MLSPQINGNAIFGDRWASLESTVRPIFLGAVAMSAFFLSHRYHTQKTITCFEEPFTVPLTASLNLSAASVGSRRSSKQERRR